MAADDSHEKITDDVSAGGAKQLSSSAAESAENRKAGQAQQYVNDYAEGSPLHTKNGYGKVDCKGSKGEGHRTYGNGEGQGAQNTNNSRH